MECSGNGYGNKNENKASIESDGTELFGWSGRLHFVMLVLTILQLFYGGRGQLDQPYILLVTGAKKKFLKSSISLESWLTKVNH